MTKLSPKLQAINDHQREQNERRRMVHTNRCADCNQTFRTTNAFDAICPTCDAALDASMRAAVPAFEPTRGDSDKWAQRKREQREGK